MKILYLTSRLPYPPIGGDRLRTFAFIKYLSKKYELDLLSFYDDDKELDYLPDLSLYCKNISLFKRNKCLSYLYALRSFIDHKPFQVNYYYFHKVKRYVKDIYKQYDLILVHLLRMAQYVIDLPVPKMIDMTDCLSLSWKSQAAYVPFYLRGIYMLESSLLAKFESKISESFKQLFFVTDKDAKNFLNGAKKVQIISNGVNLPKISQNKKPLYDQKYVGFVGKLNTVPNKDAVNYFISEIFPLIRKEFPRLKFKIIGQNPSSRWYFNEECVVTGEVQDITEHLASCSVFVCPIRCGSGFKNKVVEAMLMKIPVVATSISVLGMGFEDGENILIADNPYEFKEAVVKLLKDEKLRDKIVNNAFKLVSERFSWDKELSKLDRVICLNTC